MNGCTYKSLICTMQGYLIHATKGHISQSAQGLCLKNTSTCTKVLEDDAV